MDRKMKDIANKTAKKKSDDDSLKRQIQDIENQAMHAFADCLLYTSDAADE